MSKSHTHPLPSAYERPQPADHREDDHKRALAALTRKDQVTFRQLQEKFEGEHCREMAADFVSRVFERGDTHLGTRFSPSNCREKYVLVRYSTSIVPVKLK